MARTARRKAEPPTQYRCRDCQNSYDWQEIGYDGKPFLCRCQYKQEGGKFCIFLNDRQCEHFILRKDDGKQAK